MNPMSYLKAFPTLLLCLVFGLAACGPEADPAEKESSAEEASSADVEDVVRQYLDLFNEQDLEAIEPLWSYPITYNGERMGRDEVVALHESYWSAFPDIEVEITHLVSDKEYAAVRLEIEGTGEGEYLGHDVEGKEVQVSEIALFHVSDDQLDEYWTQWDELGFWEQLGVLESPYPEE